MFRAEYVGPEQLHAGIHLTVASETTVAEGEQIIAEVRRRVHEDIAEAAHCVIELDRPSRRNLPNRCPARFRQLNCADAIGSSAPPGRFRPYGPEAWTFPD